MKDSPAFPYPATFFPDGRGYDSGAPGLTKREFLAAIAMQGLVVPCTAGRHNSNDPAECASKALMAVRLADALIAELELTDV
jgi:hypothetical protein